MKKVIFVRHAKSSWADPELRDIERPLNKRGRRDGPFMAELLRRKGEKPDLIISSPAVRAFRTASYFAREFDIKPDDIRLEKRIYHAFPDDVIQLVQEQDDSHYCLLIFGHNPTFTTLVNMFSDQYIDNVPTCGIFEIISDSKSWSEFSPENSQLAAFHYPKQYFKK